MNAFQKHVESIIKFSKGGKERFFFKGENLKRDERRVLEHLKRNPDTSLKKKISKVL